MQFSAMSKNIQTNICQNIKVQLTHNLITDSSIATYVETMCYTIELRTGHHRDVIHLLGFITNFVEKEEDNLHHPSSHIFQP